MGRNWNFEDNLLHPTDKYPNQGFYGNLFRVFYYPWFRRLQDVQYTKMSIRIIHDILLLNVNYGIWKYRIKKITTHLLNKNPFLNENEITNKSNNLRKNTKLEFHNPTYHPEEIIIEEESEVETNNLINQR